MEVELLKAVAQSGITGVLLFFVLWKMIPALGQIATSIARLNTQMDLMLSNHLEHLTTVIEQLAKERKGGE